MNRAIISQRITSILAEIERLNNALYAMNTTDIQRYPDNYEVLSTDAALRAIARKTLARKSGARGLRSIMERIMTNVM